MKRFTQYTIGTVFALALSGAAWAQQRDRVQQRDLEVTMDVVPANASADATGEIKLPITLPATRDRQRGSRDEGRSRPRLRTGSIRGGARARPRPERPDEIRALVTRS